MTEPDARLAELTARMEQLGAGDPAGWARSEVSENIAQQARYLFLRRLWPEAIDAWRDPAVLARVPAAARVLGQGANPTDLSRAMCLAAYEAVFAVLSILDEGCDPDAPEDAPGWQLMETDLLSDQPTGRDVGGLHEDILSLDPSGREGSDLFLLGLLVPRLPPEHRILASGYIDSPPRCRHPSRATLQTHWRVDDWFIVICPVG